MEITFQCSMLGQLVYLLNLPMANAMFGRVQCTAYIRFPITLEYSNYDTHRFFFILSFKLKL